MDVVGFAVLFWTWCLGRVRLRLGAILDSVAMAGAAAFLQSSAKVTDAFLQSSAKVTDLIQTVNEVTAAVEKLQSELALIRISIAASSAALRTVNDKVNELHDRVEDMEARLSRRFADSTSPHVDTF